MTKDIASKLTLKRLADELSNMNRQMKALQKTVDLLYADREILENVVGRLAGVEERLSLARQHDNEVRKDIKEEVQIANDRVVARVETQVESIKDIIEHKKVIQFKNPFKWFWQKKR